MLHYTYRPTAYRAYFCEELRTADSVCVQFFRYNLSLRSQSFNCTLCCWCVALCYDLPPYQVSHSYVFKLDTPLCFSVIKGVKIVNTALFVVFIATRFDPTVYK
jgi:hypothetical protein